MGNVDNGGGYVCVGAQSHGNSLYLPLCFVLNLKLLFKNLSLKIFFQIRKLKSPQKVWTVISPNKTYRWQIHKWKDAQHHVSLRNCKQNKEIPLHTYQNGKNTKHWQNGMLERSWRNSSHSLLAGMPDGTATCLDYQLFTKLNTTLPYNPTVMLLAVCPNELKAYVHTKSWT